MKKQIIPFLIILFVACSKNKVPDYVIPEDKMVDIIVDLHVSDGIMNMYEIRNEILKYKKENIYNQILSLHGYNRHDFDTSVYYYSYNINQYDEIYKKVLSRLTEKEARIKEEGLKKTDSTKNVRLIEK
ncbi:MAG: DUF4296 domain-containing protein [Bacteroidales bacterium]|nr:DUF4296 domain-containing protein [Bacteroidales bacterium]